MINWYLNECFMLVFDKWMGFGENIVIILFSRNKFFEDILPLCNDVVGYWYSFLLRGKLTINVDFSQMLSEKSLDRL